MLDFAIMSICLLVLTFYLGFLTDGSDLTAHHAQEAQKVDRPNPVSTPTTAPEAKTYPISEPQSQHRQIADQPRPTRDLFDRMALGTNIALALFGLFGICIAVCTLKAIKRQAVEMERASAHATKQLEHEQRPWLLPTVTLSGPLDYMNEGPRVAITIALDNVGRTPAVGIWVNPVLYIPGPSKNSPDTERKRLCEELIDRPRQLGHTIFPNRNFTQPITIGARREDVEANPSEPFYGAYIIVCVAYQSTLDESARYYTGVVYTLHRILERRPGAASMLIKGKSTLAKELSLDMDLGILTK